MIGEKGLLDQLDKFEDTGSTHDVEKDYVQKDKHRKFKEYNKLILILIAVLFFVLLFVIDYAKFMVLVGKDVGLTDDEQTFIITFKQQKDSYASMLGNVFPFLAPSTTVVALPDSLGTLTGDSLKTTINDYLSNQDVSYSEKKDGFNAFMKKFIEAMTANESAINKVRSDIGVYGFLPQEVDTVVSDNSLQRSILGVEAIKLYAALHVFSKLDSFLNSFASVTGGTPDAVSTQLDYYLSRGEIDIERYLADCSLNPYQNGQCNKSNITDFDSFYSYSGLNQKFNSSTFKNLMQYLSQTLENDSFPKLSILANNLDPVKDQIGFVIEINTFPDDEKALAAKGILSPHIYIAGKLMDLLRQSSFISGKDLSFDTLKVAKKTYTVGSTSVDVNNSAFNFTVFIKKTVERQIYDYFYGN